MGMSRASALPSSSWLTVLDHARRVAVLVDQKRVCAIDAGQYSCFGVSNTGRGRLRVEGGELPETVADP